MDLFATKGLEYLLVIGYLVLLVGFWRFVTPRKRKPTSKPVAVPHGFYFHQGHTWIVPEHGTIVRVGMDDFAEHLLGADARPILPDVGTELHEGEPGWQVELGDDTIPILSPVNGRVVAINRDVLAAPELVAREPYHHGWLLEVKVQDAEVARRNLLSGHLARMWMREVNHRFEEEVEPGQNRAMLAREFLLLAEHEETRRSALVH